MAQEAVKNIPVRRKRSLITAEVKEGNEKMQVGSEEDAGEKGGTQGRRKRKKERRKEKMKERKEVKERSENGGEEKGGTQKE